MENLNPNLKKEFLAKGYLIGDKIGEGGCSYIYKAQRINTEIFVAIKLLKLPASYGKLAKLELISYFKQSNALYDSLHHSNIVVCFENGELLSGMPYAIFEYIPGKTLKQFLILRTSISPIVIASIMGEVLKVLAYAHSIGVIHGDLKPHNIMISRSVKAFHVKLIDFGFYKPLNGFESSELKFLSPQYNAPEQLSGNPPTCKSDLYSWGLIVLECITGKVAVSGHSMKDIYANQLRAKDVDIPSDIKEHDLGYLLQKILKKNRLERFDDTRQLLKEFSSLDFSTLPNCFSLDRQACRLNTDNTILSALE